MKEKDKLPEGWTEVTIGDLISEQQCDEIMRIIYQTHDSIERVRKLSAYLERFKDELAEKGVLPRYLAYVLEHKISNESRK